MQMSAVEKLEALGSAMGQSLIAGDLAALVAHKRAASLRRGSSVSTRAAPKTSRRGEHVRSHRSAVQSTLRHAIITAISLATLNGTRLIIHGLSSSKCNSYLQASHACVTMNRLPALAFIRHRPMAEFSCTVRQTDPQ